MTKRYNNLIDYVTQINKLKEKEARKSDCLRYLLAVPYLAIWISKLAWLSVDHDLIGILWES